MSNKDLSGYLWTPDGLANTAIDDIVVRRQNEVATAMTFTFEFHYQGKAHKVQVVAESDVSRAQVEDSAAKIAEKWMAEIDEKEYKRPPTEDERKQIGKSMNEFLQHARRRRESSNGKIYYPGVTL